VAAGEEEDEEEAEEEVETEVAAILAGEDQETTEIMVHVLAEGTFAGRMKSKKWAKLSQIAPFLSPSKDAVMGS
jgi:hypothetical protein